MSPLRRRLLLGGLVCLAIGALALAPRLVGLWREARTERAFAETLPQRLVAWVRWTDTFRSLGDAPRWPWSASLRVASLRDVRSPWRFPPVDLEAELEPGPKGWSFRVRASGAGKHPGEPVVLAVGEIDRGPPALRSELHLEELRFEPGELSLADLSPQLASLVRSFRGGLEATADVRWSAQQGPDASVDVAFRDLDLATDALAVQRLNGVVRVEGPSPLRTPPSQLLSMARVDLGLQLLDGLVSFQLRPDGQVELESAAWSLAGGRLLTSGRFDPRARQQSVVLRVEGVQLKDLLELVTLEGLSGSGVLEGEIPLVRQGEEIEIRGGRLHALGDGWVRWDPGPAAAGLAASAPGFDVLVPALRNFHYEELVLELDGDARGSVDLSLHLSGSNPEYRDGHPVELNLTLDAMLADVFQARDVAYRVPAEIERRLRALAERGALRSLGGSSP